MLSDPGSFYRKTMTRLNPNHNPLTNTYLQNPARYLGVRREELEKAVNGLKF